MCSRPFSPSSLALFRFFFFNDTATTEIYTLSLHDALPIYAMQSLSGIMNRCGHFCFMRRSEEHTSELQSRVDLVCRLLLEKKKERWGTKVPGEKKKKRHGPGCIPLKQ